MTVENPYLVSTEVQRKVIREKVMLNEDGLSKDIDTVLEWFKKQQHLPRVDLDRRLIENLLVSRKGSVEQTKQKIDMLFTLRNMVPEMAILRDIKHPKIVNSLKGCTFLMLPKLNNDYTRVGIFKYKDPDFFNLVDTMNFIWMVMEYRQLYDYSLGDRYILDLENFTIGHLAKYSPSIVKNMELFIRKAYGIRLFGAHLINASNILNQLLALMKMALSKKLSSRIIVHETSDDLHTIIDKDILPAEYGGNESSFDTLMEAQIQDLSKDEHRDYLISQGKLRSNEDLRIGGNLDEELLGVAGSFKKLDVD